MTTCRIVHRVKPQTIRFRRRLSNEFDNLSRIWAFQFRVEGTRGRIAQLTNLIHRHGARRWSIFQIPALIGSRFLTGGPNRPCRGNIGTRQVRCGLGVGLGPLFILHFAILTLH